MDDSRSLNDDLFDVAMKEALRQFAHKEELEAERILDTFVEESAGIEPSSKFRANMRYLSRKAEKQKAPVKIYPRFARIAAMFALLAGIGAAVTLGVEAYRNGLFGWVLRQNNVYTSLETEDSIVRECSSRVFAQTEWDYYYFPENLPKDFQLESVEAGTERCDISLTHEEQEIRIKLNAMRDDSLYSAAYDTEDTRGLQRVMLGDYECYYVIKTYPQDLQVIQVICNNGDFWFSFVFRNVPQKEAFKIVESMQKVKRE